VDQTLHGRLSFLLVVADAVPGGVLVPTDLRAEEKNWSLQFTGRDYWEEQGADKTHD